MARRYLFLCGDKSKPSGGRAVIYDIAATVREAGYDAYVLHGSADAKYPGARVEVPLAWNPQHVTEITLRKRGRLAPLTVAKGILSRRSRGANVRIEPGRDDVIVAPEHLMPAALAAYPESKTVVLSQNSFAFVREYAVALENGLDPGAVFWHLGIAEICMEAFEATDARPASYFPVQANLSAFPYRQEKERLITYMPRKRRAEARVIAEALRRRGKLGDFRLEPIDGRPQSEVADLLGRSAIFISLMRSEALGFPGMEAMSSGCIVVGYTGLGTREYFDTSTGVPVVDDDLFALVRAVEDTVAELGSDPARLDGMRRHASELVNDRYSYDRFRDGVLSAFAQIDAALDAAGR